MFYVQDHLRSCRFTRDRCPDEFLDRNDRGAGRIALRRRGNDQRHRKQYLSKRERPRGATMGWLDLKWFNRVEPDRGIRASSTAAA